MNLSNERFIIELLENKTPESEKIEYKAYQFKNGKLKSLEQKSKNKLFQEICSMANSNGGKIIIGIKEDKDHNPIEVQDVKVEESQFEEWEQSFRLILSTQIRPVLHGVVCNHILLNVKENLIIINIPKSIQRPHAFNNGNKDEFFIRYGNICRTMTYDQLKMEFLVLENTQQRIQDFRDNRIAMLVNDEIFPQIAEKSALLLHIIPEWAMDNENFLDVRNARNNLKMTVFSPGLQGNILYNADGISFVYGDGDNPIMSYLQLFHNGIIEAAEFGLLNEYKENTFYHWCKVEELIAEKIHDYCIGLTELNIPYAFYILVSLVNVKGKKASYSETMTSEPLTRSIIKTRMAYWNDGQNYAEAISPILNSLANAFGMEKSTLYDKELKPIASKFSWLYKE